MYHDLNVPYTSNHEELRRTIFLLAELGYDTIALNHNIAGSLPSKIVNPIPAPLPFATPPKLRILRRCTLQYSDPSQNYRLSTLSSAYDIFALRPTTEKALQQACQCQESEIISLDMSVRHSFYFPIKTLKSALERGASLEICYAPGILNTDGGAARRNLISNAMQLIRGSRSRGLIISSEAKIALACRAPADLVNLCTTWGLSRERGVEALTRQARATILRAGMKRRSFKGVVDVVYGGEAPHQTPLKSSGTQSKQQNVPSKLASQKSSKVPEKQDVQATQDGKRKADSAMNIDEADIVLEPAQLSKREIKRRAKKARMERAAGKTEPVAKEVGP